MGLVLKDLQDELKVLYDKGKTGNPEPILVGLKTGTAYFNYVSAGMNAAGFPFTGMSGTKDLQDALGDLLKKSPNQGPSHAATYSMRVNSCLSTFLSVHQTSIITAAGTSALFQELDKLYSRPKGHASLFAMALGRALNNYTVSAVVMGIIPDTPGIPFTGPIS